METTSGVFLILAAYMILPALVVLGVIGIYKALKNRAGRKARTT